MAIEIKIKSIKEEEFKFTNDNLPYINKDLLSVGFQLGFKVDMEHNLFTVRFTVTYNYKIKGKKRETEIMKFKTSTKFQIDDIKEIIKFEGDSKDIFEIPDPIIYSFVGTAISSARGMLVYKLAGTKIADLYIPLINVESLLKKSHSKRLDNDES